MCVRVRVRTWACVYTGAGGRRSHAALAFSRTAPSGAPSPLACSFTCPHPDISVPQSGLWQLAPLLLPAAPPLTGSEHVVPQDPHLTHSPLPWGPLSPSPQPFTVTLTFPFLPEAFSSPGP